MTAPAVRVPFSRWVRGAFGLATTAVLVSCQLVGSYATFESAPAETEPEPETLHRCNSLPRAKPDDRGLGTMVLIESDEDRCFWIDRTEVTVDAYAAYLADVGSTPDWDPVRCAWKEGPSNPAATSDDTCAQASVARAGGPFTSAQPIRCVDWCDADAFCRWGGKHLCYGRLATNFQGLDTPRNFDDWAIACAGPERGAMPYGPKPEAGRCNVGRTVADCHSGSCFPAPASSFPVCGYDGGPINMVGNVAEWISVCQTQGAAEGQSTDVCAVVGGSSEENLDLVTCYYGTEFAERASRAPEIGMRCCAELSFDEEVSLAP